MKNEPQMSETLLADARMLKLAVELDRWAVVRFLADSYGTDLDSTPEVFVTEAADYGLDTEEKVVEALASFLARGC